MPPITLDSAPALDTFTTLEQYQARTPAVFFNAKPILHYHSRSVRACAPRSQSSKLPIFAQAANEQADEAAGDNVVEQMEIFVSSEYV
jgi:nucleotide-sensitive chloride channel 1A